MTHTYEEIKVYINDNFDYLNLSEKEEERYIKFINKMDNYINSHPNKFVSDTFILFQNNPDTVYIYPVLSGKYLSDTPLHYPILLNHGNNTFLNYPQ